MDLQQLQTTVIDALESVKAQNIRIFETAHLTGLFDRVAIASGTSNRQTKALAASVRDKVKQQGGDIVSIEGEETGEWVLVDLGDIVVHIMQPAIRDYYRLEEIWGGKEIDLKAVPKKIPATKPSTRKTPVRKNTKTAAAETAIEATTSVSAEEPAKPIRKRAPRKSSVVE